MKRLMKRILVLSAVVCTVTATLLPAHAEALITQGSSELGIGDGLDITSAVGTDVSLDIRYAYFFWDQISIGGVAGFGDNDAATSFKIGAVGEYNFKLSDNYQPLIGTDFVPYAGLGLSYQYVDIYHEHESALVLTTEGGVKFFLTDSAAITLSAVLDLATEKIYPDDDDADMWNFALRLGMRFHF